MRRKKKIKKIIQPDFKYNSVLASKFINYLMKGGKKSAAQKVFYDALEILREKKKSQDPLEIFDKAIKNVSPILEVKSRRIGGANYQVPREVRGERKISLSFRWLIKAARTRRGKSMAEKLAEELVDASQNIGAAIKKKQDTHRMAEANKAFAHFGF
jgi:small subunit ribosomal protein S7